jgi:hypothetical protein
MKVVSSRVARTLFQVGSPVEQWQLPSGASVGRHVTHVATPTHGTDDLDEHMQDSTTNVHEGFKNTTVNDPANSVKESKMACNSDNANDVSHKSAGRDKVSFGTYMSTDEEVLDDGSVQLSRDAPTTATKRFHARKCWRS